jgi:hypothetical protein
MNVHFNNIVTAHSSAGTGFQVMVFRTNLRLKKDIRQISPVFNRETGILRWNIDTQDIDHVLRIETDRLTMQEVIALVTGVGYCCEELPD